MTQILPTFAIGLIILLISSQFLVKSATKLSQMMRISPLIIGITVVAIGTSLPELAVSLFAESKHDPGLAQGNIIGSNILNILLVFGIALVIHPIRVGTKKTQANANILLLATAAFILIKNLSLPPITSGLFLIIGAILAIIFDYHEGAAGRLKEDLRYVLKLKKTKFTPTDLFVMIFSFVGIVAGGLIVVDSVETISKLTGYSTTVLGLSLTAFATSLPELITIIISEESHQEKIALGSLIGSNIYNLLFIGGITSLFSTVNYVNTIEWVVLSLITLTFFAIIKFYRGRYIPRSIGVLLLCFCVLYLLTLKQ